MKKLILLVSFLFCLPVFGQDKNQEFESDSYGYEYSCNLKTFITRSKSFNYRQEALDWCQPFGKFCVARRGAYRGWQGYFERKSNFDFRSEKSWGDARWNVFKKYQDHLGQNDYFHQNFRHSFSFDKCY